MVVGSYHLHVPSKCVGRVDALLVLRWFQSGFAWFSASLGAVCHACSLVFPVVLSCLVVQEYFVAVIFVVFSGAALGSCLGGSRVPLAGLLADSRCSSSSRASLRGCFRVRFVFMMLGFCSLPMRGGRPSGRRLRFDNFRVFPLGFSRYLHGFACECPCVLFGPL